MEKSEPSVKEWDFNPSEILASPRKVQGIFHQPVIDKDGELISPDGMRKAVPDFMHLPALHDFHKERPVGLATKIKELSGGRFWFEGVIKATKDCDDIWEKVKTGNYDQVSIFGKRTKYNNQCALPQNMRSGPCVTDGVRLDSISVCDENARNPQTSLEVRKAKVIFDSEELEKGKKPKGSYDKSGVWVSAEEKQEDEENRKQYPNSSYGKAETNEVDKAYAHLGKNPNITGEKVHAMRAQHKDIMENPRTGDWIKMEDKSNAMRGLRSLTEEKKAETAGDSSLMHTSTDYAEEKDFEKGRNDRKPGKYGSMFQHNKKRNQSANKEINFGGLDSETIDSGNESSDRVAAARASDRKYQLEHGGEETESAMTGMRNLHKGGKVRITKCPRCQEDATTISKEVEKAGDYEERESDEYSEDRPTKKETVRHGKKESFMPMRETGAPIPKRTQSGYPLRVGGNVPKKPEHAPGKKGTAPAPERLEERNKNIESMKEKDVAERHERFGRDVNATKPSVPGPRKMTGHRLGGVRKADDMEEPIEKGIRPKVTEEPAERGSTSQKNRKDVRQRGEIRAENIRINKADDEDVEKGKRKVTSESRKKDPNNRGKYVHSGETTYDQDEIDEDVEKGAAENAQEGMYEDDDYDHAKPSDKEGNWNKSKNPNGTPGLKKAKADSGPDEDENEEEREDEDEEEDVEKGRYDRQPVKIPSGEVLPSMHEHAKRAIKDKNIRRVGHAAAAIHGIRENTEEERSGGDRLERESAMEGMRNLHKGEDVEKSRPGDMIRGKQELARRGDHGPVDSRGQADAAAHTSMPRALQNKKSFNKDSNLYNKVRNERLPKTMRKAKGDEDNASELFDPSTVTKGEQMEEHETNDVEYVTKALVPIEEIDTIVKARTEEISKAYMGQLDEIKKAYDAKFVEMSSKLEKMENETIRKGGSVVVIPELLRGGDGAQSNADAIAKMQAGR